MCNERCCNMHFLICPDQELGEKDGIFSSSSHTLDYRYVIA